MDGLANRVLPEDRKKVECAIAERVPRPTPDEYKQAARDRVQSLGWDWVSERHPKIVAALADEADRWRGTEAGLSLALRGEVRCRFCKKPTPSNSFTAMCSGERNYFCDKCVVAGLQLLENGVVYQSAQAAADVVHHTEGP